MGEEQASRPCGQHHQFGHHRRSLHNGQKDPCGGHGGHGGRSNRQTDDGCHAETQDQGIKLNARSHLFNIFIDTAVFQYLGKCTSCGNDQDDHGNGPHRLSQGLHQVGDLPSLFYSQGI